MKMPQPLRRQQQGLTLVEMMIAMVLSTVLIAAAFGLVNSQSTTYEKQAGAAELDITNLSVVTLLRNRLRQAGHGFGFCPGRDIRIGGFGSTRRFSAFLHFNACDISQKTKTQCAAVTSTQAPDSFAIGFLEPPTGADDVISIRSSRQIPMSGKDVYVKAPGYFVTDQWINLQPSDTLAKPCVMRKLTANPQQVLLGEFKLFHDDGGENLSGGVGVLMASSTLVTLMGTDPKMSFFAVQTESGGSTKPWPRLVTWQTRVAEPKDDYDDSTAEIVADGVEDVQIAFGCDMDVNGVITEGVTATAKRNDEWAHNVVLDNPPDCANSPLGIGAIRVTVTVRDRSADPQKNNGYLDGSEDRLVESSARDLTLSQGFGTFRRVRSTIVIKPQNMSR